MTERLNLLRSRFAVRQAQLSEKQKLLLKLDLLAQERRLVALELAALEVPPVDDFKLGMDILLAPSPEPVVEVDLRSLAQDPTQATQELLDLVN